MQAYTKLLMIGMLAGLMGAAVPATTGSPFLDMMRGMATGLVLLGQNGNTAAPAPTIIYPQVQPLPVPAYPPFPGGFPWAPSLPGWPPTPPYGASPFSGIPWMSLPASGATPYGAAPLASGAIPYGSTPWTPPVSHYRGGNILNKLQGAWETDKGGLLLVRGNMARLYVSREEHQDLYITADPRYLLLQPVGSQSPTRYEYHLYGDRLVLRDGRGNRLVLRRYEPNNPVRNLP